MPLLISQKYSPDQPRDDHGRWGEGGGGHAAVLAQPSSAYPPALVTGRDTQQRFKLADGTYTPERQALHAAITAKILEGKTPVEAPTSYMLGGGPASGKSSVTGLTGIPENTVAIDSDEIKGMLPEYREGFAAGDKDSARFAHEESSDISKAIMQTAVSGRYNTLLDGTGDNSIESLTAKTVMMRAFGAPLEANYLTIDTDEAVRRAAARERQVPESVVRATHASVSHVFPEAIGRQIFDKWTLWDNNVARGAPPRAIAAGGRGKATLINDHAAWDRFLAKGSVKAWAGKSEDSTMLTSEEIERILMEVVGRQQPTLRTPEADAFRVVVMREVHDIEARGHIVEIPFEMLKGV